MLNRPRRSTPSVATMATIIRVAMKPFIPKI
jgi:hypothetical protein